MADAAHQTQVGAGRVPTVTCSSLACYAALDGESGLAETCLVRSRRTSGQAEPSLPGAELVAALD